MLPSARLPFLAASLDTQHFLPWIAPLLECKLFRSGTASVVHLPQHLTQPLAHAGIMKDVSLTNTQEDERRTTGITPELSGVDDGCNGDANIHITQEFCLRPVECKLITEIKWKLNTVPSFRRKVSI